MINFISYKFLVSDIHILNTQYPISLKQFYYIPEKKVKLVYSSILELRISLMAYIECFTVKKIILNTKI
jgi:hypothetical protein